MNVQHRLTSQLFNLNSVTQPYFSSMLSNYRTGLERGRHEATGRHERQESRQEPAANAANAGNAARERGPDGLGPFVVGQE